MHKLKEHITNLKAQLEDIHIQLNPWLNKTAKQEVQSQLNAIVKSTDKLTKTEVNIPTELRELKFKLIKELDKYKEAEEQQNELLEFLSQYVSIKQQSKSSKSIVEKQVKKVKTTTPQFELINLINSGLIAPNAKIVKQYKGHLHTAIITKEGKIKTNFKNQVILHNSPSSAAVYLTQKSQNGWTWWQIEGDAKDRTLNYYRQQYLKQANETRR
jgi:hypothetical protein